MRKTDVSSDLSVVYAYQRSSWDTVQQLRFMAPVTRVFGYSRKAGRFNEASGSPRKGQSWTGGTVGYLVAIGSDVSKASLAEAKGPDGPRKLSSRYDDDQRRAYDYFILSSLRAVAGLYDTVKAAQDEAAREKREQEQAAKDAVSALQGRFDALGLESVRVYSNRVGGPYASLSETMLNEILERLEA